MANPHFGEIGDIWKHLVLGDLLDRLRPARYWESHAGSGTYTLDRTWEREYGVLTLLREAPRAPAIESSRAVWLWRTLPPGEVEEPRHPGSARLAMEVLGDAATYLLCDLDATSLADLARSARELGLGDITRIERADGLGTIHRTALELPADDRPTTFVLLDPFDETERSSAGLDALDVFGSLATAGIVTALWFGYDEAPDRDTIHARLAVDGVAAHAFDIGTAFLRGRTTLHPGVGGCGMALANVGADHLDHVERLGKQLAALYDEALMPDGTPGSLTFERTELG